MLRLMPEQASSISEIENGSMRLRISACTQSPLAPRPRSMVPTRLSNWVDRLCYYPNKTLVTSFSVIAVLSAPRFVSTVAIEDQSEAALSMMSRQGDRTCTGVLPFSRSVAYC